MVATAAQVIRQVVTSAQLAHAREEAARVDRQQPLTQETVGGDLVDPRRKARNREQLLHLRHGREVVRQLDVVERFDPEAIAAAEQYLPAFVPQREAPHAIEAT